MKFLKVLFPLVIILLASCVSDQSRYVVPGETLDKMAVYYVVKAENDERNLNASIVREMISNGFAVFTGIKDNAPIKTDYLINYGSQWQWDITWYLLDFDIRVYTKEHNLFVASANSQQTSLVRDDHSKVVANVINELFSKNL